MRYLSIGHAAYDITIPVESYPIENKKIKVYDNIACGGGSASNAAYLLAKWGCDSSISCVIGNDYYGNKIVEEFNQIGVDLTYLEKRDDVNTTISYIIANNQNGSRTILTNKDKNLDFKYMDIDSKFDCILVDRTGYSLAKKVLKKNQDVISILDAEKTDSETLELSKLVKYLVVSNDFAREYTKLDLDYKDINSIKTIYEKIKEDFKEQIVIITLENFGSFTKVDDKYFLIPTIKVNAKDSTGAGDIYHGALLYFISIGYDLLKAMELANIAGAISVTRVGGRNSIPTLKEVVDHVK